MGQREVWREEQQSWELAACSATELFEFISNLLYWSFSAISWFSWADPPFESFLVSVFLSLYIAMDLKYYFKRKPAVLCF